MTIVQNYKPCEHLRQKWTFQEQQPKYGVFQEQFQKQKNSRTIQGIQERVATLSKVAGMKAIFIAIFDPVGPTSWPQKAQVRNS